MEEGSLKGSEVFSWCDGKIAEFIDATQQLMGFSGETIRIAVKNALERDKITFNKRRRMNRRRDYR